MSFLGKSPSFVMLMGKQARSKMGRAELVTETGTEYRQIDNDVLGLGKSD